MGQLPKVGILIPYGYSSVSLFCFAFCGGSFSTRVTRNTRLSKRSVLKRSFKPPEVDKKKTWKCSRFSLSSIIFNFGYGYLGNTENLSNIFFNPFSLHRYEVIE